MWNSILRNKIVKLSHLTQFLNMCVDFIVLFRLTSLFIFLFACFVALRVLHLLLLLPQSDLSLSTYCACTGLLLQLITLSKTHIQTQSVGLFWFRDRPVADTSTFTTLIIHMRQTSMPPAGIRTHNSNKRTAAYRRLRQGGHQYRHTSYLHISADNAHIAHQTVVST